MDQLLTKDIEKVSDVRGEVMGLYMHMEQEIQKFVTEYESLCQRQTQDLSARQANQNTTLQHLKAKHEQASQSLLQKHDAMVKSLQNEIQQASQRKSTADRTEEDRYHAWEKQHQDYVNQEFSKDHQKKLEVERFFQKFETVRQRVRNALPKDLYNDIIKNVQIAPCNTEQDAEAVLKRYDDQNRTDIENEILKIQNSLLRRLFFHGKRNQLCCAIEQMTEEISAASAVLDRVRSTHEDQIQQNFDQLKIQHKNQMSSIKQGNLNTFEQKKRMCNQKITQAYQTYKRDDAQLEQQYTAEYKQKETDLKTEFANAQRNWNMERMKAEKNFAAKMEAEFPVARCYALFRNLWQMTMEFHPNVFGTKPMVRGEALRNVAVGEQIINVSRWYQTTNGGQAVKKLMSSKYSFLFQPFTQNGKNMIIPEHLYLPFFFSLEKGEHIIACAPDKCQDKMESLLQAVGIRLLWAIPAGQTQFLLGDAYKIGSFFELTFLDPATFNAGGTSSYKSILSGNQPYNSIREISQKISDHKVPYNSSGNLAGAASLREYNVKHPLNHQSFLIAMLQKFPTGLNEETLQSLEMLAKDCGKKGYSSILSGSDTNFKNVDPKLKTVWNQVLQSSSCLYMNEQKIFTIHSSASAFERGSMVRIYPVPDTKVLEDMKNELKEETELAGHNTIYFEKAKEICPKQEDCYTECADNGIVVPMGYLDGGETFKLVFDDSRVHIIVNGDTGSGKTNLLHILITNILLRYSPEEVELYMIDFKRGKEFRKYTNFNLPGLKAVSIGNEPEYALKVLQDIEKQIANRNVLFGDITKLSDYNKMHPDKKLPRIVVVLDELYELILEAKEVKSGKSNNIRTAIMNLLKNFAIQARAYGVHMVIAGQHLTEIPELKLIKESCNTKIALGWSEKETEILINKSAGELMRLITRQDKGKCIVQLEKNGNPQMEHTAFLDPVRQHIQLLREIHKHYCQKKQYGNPRILTVEVASNPNNVFMRYMERGDLSMVTPEQIWIGECISMDQRSAVLLNNKNLWIAGGATQEAEEASQSLIFFVILSLLLQQKKANNKIVFYNGDTDQNNPIGIHDRAGEISLALPELIHYMTGDQLATALQFVYEKLSARKMGNSGDKETIWFVLRKPENIMMRDARAMQMFQEILLEGPSFGIRTILYTLEPQKLPQLNLGSMPFAEKLILEMDASLYQQVLGSKPSVEPRNFVISTSSSMRIRVYDLPAKLWVEEIVKKIKS